MGLVQKARGRRINPDGSQERTFSIGVLVAGDAAKEVPLLVSHVDLYLYKAFFINQATIASHASNYRTLQLRDKGAAGTGTTAAGGIYSTITTTGDGDLTAFVDADIKATAGYKLVAGSVLALNLTDNGTSPAVDGICVIVCK